MARVQKEDSNQFGQGFNERKRLIMVKASEMILDDY